MITDTDNIYPALSSRQYSAICKAYILSENCGAKIYDLDSILTVFNAFFAEYKKMRDAEHPEVKESQLVDIICKMPYLDNRIHRSSKRHFDISPDEYPALIKAYFKCREYKDSCNWRIYHFFSGNIRRMRWKDINRLKPLIPEGEKAVPMPEDIKKRFCSK